MQYEDEIDRSGLDLCAFNTSSDRIEQEYRASKYSKEAQKSRIAEYKVYILYSCSVYFIIFGVVQIFININASDWTTSLNCIQKSCNGTFKSIQTKSQTTLEISFTGLTQKDIKQSDCNNFITNKEMGKTLSFQGSQLNASMKAIPCGRFNFFYPNGNLSILSNETNMPIIIDDSDLTAFKVPVDNDNIFNEQWVDQQSDRYQSWIIDTASLAVSRVFGRIPIAFSGNYTVTFEMTELVQTQRDFYNSNNFSVTIRQSSKNWNLCGLNFAYSIVLIIISKILSMSLSDSKKISAVTKRNEDKHSNNNVILDIQEHIGCSSNSSGFSSVSEMNSQTSSIMRSYKHRRRSSGQFDQAKELKEIDKLRTDILLIKLLQIG